MKIVVGLIVLIMVLLTGCGGGGDDSGNNKAANGGIALTPVVLNGTTSAGTPLSEATVTVTDSTGKQLQTTADEKGAFKFSDVSSHTPPLLISATGNTAGNAVTYSSVLPELKAGTNVANATPLTDALVFQATSKSSGYLQGNPSELVSVTASKVNASVGKVVSAISNVLDQVTPGSSTGYNPISTPFIANGTNSYDKIFDLLSVYPSTAMGSTSVAINIADKSGSNAAINIPSEAGGTTSPMAPLPSAIIALPIEDLPAVLSKISSLASTTDGLSSAEFSGMLSDGYLNNGLNRSQRLTQTTTPSSTSYFLGIKFSNFIINSCDGATKVCDTSFKFTLGNGASSVSSNKFIYSLSKGWQSHGNQQPDLAIGFQSYAMSYLSQGNLLIGINFGIRSALLPAASNPYKSAIATFQDSNNNIDGILYFVEKPSVGSNCSPSNSSYYGLPLTNTNDPGSKTIDLTTSHACDNWITITDETMLKSLNQKIAHGGYKIVVRAYTTSDWTGTEVKGTLPLTVPLLTSDQVNLSMFPMVSIRIDSQGPYLSVGNAADFVSAGSVCLSTIFQNGCDMTNHPNYTSEYKDKSGTQLRSIYRPLAADGWPAGSAITTFFVHAKDKWGRDLRVTQ